MLKNDSFEVLTSSGFQKFKGIKKSYNPENLKIKTQTNEIIVTPDHKFFVDNNFIKAQDLKIGDELGGSTIIEIKKELNHSGIFYDLIEVENGHHFTSNNFEVSNCAYLDPEGWNEFVDGVMPSQSGLSFKKNILLSTPKGKNHFYDIWAAAGDSKETTKNDYVRFLVDWKGVPRYKSDGTLYTPEEFRDEQVRKNGLVYFNSAYACSFIGSAHTLISGETLNTYKIKAPIDTDLKGQIKIYEEPIPDRKYIMGVDSSKEGQDYTAIQIFDISGLKFNQVFSAKLKIDYLLVPEILNEYGLKFNQCLIVIENNEGSGQSIADIMQREYEYPNLFYEYKSDSGGIRSVRKRYAYPGFRTTRQSRDLLLQVIRMLAENNRLNLCDAETIREFETFILINNKYQASGKAHDDLVMACMICFAMFKDTKDFEDVLKIVEGIKSGESLSVDLIGYSGFSDFGDFDEEDPHTKYDNYDIWRERNENNNEDDMWY